MGIPSLIILRPLVRYNQLSLHLFFDPCRATDSLPLLFAVVEMLRLLIFAYIEVINSENLWNPDFELVLIELEEVVQTSSVTTVGGGMTRG